MNFIKYLFCVLCAGVYPVFSGMVISGCSRQPDKADIILATTTSFQDSGLLDVLVTQFHKETGLSIKAIAVGSGEALMMGRRGNADILVTHSPADEEVFIKEGYGKLRQPFMYNDFIIIGPASDPANCAGAASAVDAFTRIANTKSLFISRGDKSGTHKKELALWEKASIKPTGNWYLESGSGMGEVLMIADEKNAYTLSDRGTYLAFRNRLTLKILEEKDPILINTYSVITLRSVSGVPNEASGNPTKLPNNNVKAAESFASFLMSPDTKNIIAAFGTDKYGEPLFYPSAVSD